MEHRAVGGRTVSWFSLTGDLINLVCRKIITGIIPIISIAVVLGLSAALAPDSISAQQISNLSSSGSVISFEVSIPECFIIELPDGRVRLRIEGFGTFSPPGAPELPGRILRVAVPSGGTPRVAYEILESDRLGPLRIVRVKGERLKRGRNDIPVSEFYDLPNPWSPGYMPEIVKALKPSFMGRQRVLPVQLNPVFRDGDTYSCARRLRITVTVDGAVSNLRRSATDELVSPFWKNLYSELLVNPKDVSRFLKPTAPTPEVLKGFLSPKRLKLKVPETGLYYIKADSLMSCGLSPGLSIDEIAVAKYYYDESEPDLSRREDIPFVVVEDTTTENGSFDGNDLLVFYGVGIKDDVQAGDTVALFSDYNVYWLEEETAGKRMQEATLPSGQGSKLESFNAGVVERKDTYYFKNPPITSRDYYYVKGPVPAESSLPFECHSPADNGEFLLEITVESKETTSQQHTLQFSVRNSSGTYYLGSGTISYNNRYEFSFGPFSSSWLVDGTNELLISADEDYCYLVDHFRVDYTALFVAHDDLIDFTVGNFLGVRSVDIPGFSVNRALLVDVTDLNDCYYYLFDDSYFTPQSRSLTFGPAVTGSAGYVLSFNLEALDPKHIIVLGLGNSSAEFPTSLVELDKPSSLRGESGPFDAIIISNSQFIPTLESYISKRRSEGYRVLTADVEDVFDEFNGGNPSSDAVKRFIKFGVDHWGVDFVLLVGDANEDHKRVFSKTPPDFVPTYTFCAPVVGDYPDEVVAADMWYAFLDDMGPVSKGMISAGLQPDGSSDRSGAGRLLLSDRYPDVFLGRFPVGSDVELRAIKVKIERFEDVSMDDTWRRRVILFSDDAWSGSRDYRYHAYEKEFEESMDRVSQMIEESLPGGFDIRHLYLSHWTDSVHENLYESGPEVLSRATDSTRMYFTPSLIRELNGGCLFFSFQGHANRAVLTTEAAFATFKQYDDLDSLRTYIPNVFIGIGCHISDFARVSELSRAAFDGPNGDCFSEQMLFKPGAGAVSTYASDGFEYLSQNAALCERLHSVLFQAPPTDSVPPDRSYTGAHWILGESIVKGVIEQIDATTYGLDQVIRYHLLGDPMLRISPGPPLMRLEADWGEGWEDVEAGRFTARHGSNRCRFKFTASDVIALGGISLSRNGVDITDSLSITRLNDQDLTYSRAYEAQLDFEVSLDDESLTFTVESTDGKEVGVFSLSFDTQVHLFYNDHLEILPGTEAPHTGRFNLKVDFPAYVSHVPILLIDGVLDNSISFSVPDPVDSLHWEAEFSRTFSSGRHQLTVRVGDYEKDFVFEVTGNTLVAETFNFPNPFDEGTNIVYVLNLPADSGRLDIYNVSGTLIKSFELSRSMLDAANFTYPHVIYWDGRDSAGDGVANGTYIYILRITRNGREVSAKGKMVKLR